MLSYSSAGSPSSEAGIEDDRSAFQLDAVRFGESCGETVRRRARVEPSAEVTTTPSAWNKARYHVRCARGKVRQPGRCDNARAYTSFICCNVLRHSPEYAQASSSECMPVLRHSNPFLPSSKDGTRRAGTAKVLE
jgi:hypothetical protein